MSQEKCENIFKKKKKYIVDLFRFEPNKPKIFEIEK